MQLCMMWGRMCAMVSAWSTNMSAMNIVNDYLPRVDGNGRLPSSLPDLGAGSL